MDQSKKAGKYHFGPKSRERLSSCHEDLKRLMEAAISHPDCPMDFSILTGHRGQRDQDAAFARGASNLRFPQSKHNRRPSLAVDIAPWPLDWNDIEAFVRLGAHIKRVGAEIGVTVEWGGDWRRFKDYPHYELNGV